MPTTPSVSQGHIIHWKEKDKAVSCPLFQEGDSHTSDETTWKLTKQNKCCDCRARKPSTHPIWKLISGLHLGRKVTAEELADAQAEVTAIDQWNQERMQKLLQEMLDARKKDTSGYGTGWQDAIHGVARSLNIKLN